MNSFIPLILASIVMTIGEMILVPSSQSLRAVLMNEEQIGTYSGFVTITDPIGSVLSGSLVSFSVYIHHTGVAVVMVVVTVLLVLCFNQVMKMKTQAEIASSKNTWQKCLISCLDFDRIDKYWEIKATLSNKTKGDLRQWQYLHVTHRNLRKTNVVRTIKWQHQQFHLMKQLVITAAATVYPSKDITKVKKLQNNRRSFSALCACGNSELF